ncbi:hypothetical protein BJF78_24865 [Pseudonocardia sp. CNS-139]|nr:hypothetical protein BJF78_24865 [Pseudonocardia sp. CNS-139]
MTVRWRTLLAGALLVLATGCAGPAADPDLSAALLQPADLPAGYGPIPPEPSDGAVSSTDPDCAATLDGIEVDPPADPTVQEVRALFGDATFGRIQHVVRAYPAGQAAAEVERVRAVLAGCSTFENTYADSSTVTLTVTPRTAPAVGEAAWAGEIRAETDAFALVNQLVLVQAGDRTAALSVLTPDGPDIATVDDLAERAAARL